MPNNKVFTPRYKKYNKYVFNVYRFSDVIKFLQILQDKDGFLLTVVPAYYPNGLSSGWDITYSIEKNEKPIEMEILC